MALPSIEDQRRFDDWRCGEWCTRQPDSSESSPERCFDDRQKRVVWRRAIRRRNRALLVSSPIGLGHAWRAVAIARELRALEPELEIDWLAQDPVTRVLESCGERIHPASRLLASESRHIAGESHCHELNVFQAWRRMDEILLANFKSSTTSCVRSHTTYGSVTRPGSSTPTSARTPS
jgi:hypothetical protein